jgi:hypothetical protein
MRHQAGRAVPLGLMLGLLGCSSPLPIASFAGSGPAFDPVAFFSGSIHSWGVLENRSGEPTAIVLTEGRGEAEGADAVHFPQRVTVGTAAPVMRDWHMRRVGPGRYDATANDMVGTAHGEAAGRGFHWTWTLALHPGNPLTNVSMDQWWYLQDDGSMLNRTIITKLGIVVAEVTEHFTRTP